MDLSDPKTRKRYIDNECRFVIKACHKGKECKNAITEQGLLRCPECKHFEKENDFILLGYYNLLKRISWVVNGIRIV